MTDAERKKSILSDSNWVSCKWTPLSSITAYELAQLLPYLRHANTHFEVWITRTDWDAIDPWLRRHLTEVKEDD